MDTIRIAVIGGGAAGMMAAIHAAKAGAEVTLIERMNACGKKLRIAQLHLDFSPAEDYIMAQ